MSLDNDTRHHCQLVVAVACVLFVERSFRISDFMSFEQLVPSFFNHASTGSRAGIFNGVRERLGGHHH